MSQHKLIKSNSRSLFGVCGGIADYLGWSPTKLRIVYIFGTMFTGVAPGVIIYVILVILMPAAR